MGALEESKYLGAAAFYESARFATFPITYRTTKSIVDTICIHALGQQSQPLEPCYERAAISGAIASLCSQLAADRMTNYWHAQRDHTSVVSLGTVLSIVSGGIAGVTIEAIRAKREQNLLDKVKTKQEEVAKLSDAELLLILQKRSVAAKLYMGDYCSSCIVRRCCVIVQVAACTHVSFK
jgi:hypothetical protein